MTVGSLFCLLDLDCFFVVLFGGVVFLFAGGTASSLLHKMEFSVYCVLGESCRVCVWGGGGGGVSVGVPI